MALVTQQFFPTSDRPELLIDVQLPRGSTMGATETATKRVEAFLKKQPEALLVDSYICGGGPRFFLALNSEAPDPSFAKIIIQTPDAAARDALAQKIRVAADDGLFPEGRVRTSGLLFGPPMTYPVVFRVHGPDVAVLRTIAEEVRAAMAGSPSVRDPHLEYGERTSRLRVRFDPARLAAIGLTPEGAATQLGAALAGQTVAQVRDGSRLVEVVVRAAGPDRLDAARLGSATLVAASGARIALANFGDIVTEPGEPMLRHPRGNGAAGTPRYLDRACRGARLHSVDLFDVLGAVGLRADRWGGGWHLVDPHLRARVIRCLYRRAQT